MTARLTAKEAKALGLTEPATKKRTTRKVAKGPYHTKCKTCGEEFTTAASEDRHVNFEHRRFELLFGPDENV